MVNMHHSYLPATNYCNYLQKLSGVVAFYGKEDIPGKNSWTPLNTFIFFFEDEELFCSGKVLWYHQPVGVIVAKSEEVAIAAAQLVIVTCTPPDHKPYLTIREILSASEDVKKKRVTHVTDVIPLRRGFDVKKIVKGEFNMGSQYHYHMELQCCNVVPIEGELDVYASTQWLDCVQMGIANVLGIHQAK